MPSAGLLLFPEDVEKDDYLHNPDPSDNDREKCDIFTKRGMTNLGGLALITIGLLILFVGYPALYGSFILQICQRLTIYRTFGRGVIIGEKSGCSTDPLCLSDKVALLQNQRVGLIDPDTPSSVKTKISHDGTKMNLVVCSATFQCMVGELT